MYNHRMTDMKSIKAHYAGHESRLKARMAETLKNAANPGNPTAADQDAVSDEALPRVSSQQDEQTQTTLRPQ